MSVVTRDCGLRQLVAFLLPRVQTSIGQRSFAYSGPAVWNSLPPNTARRGEGGGVLASQLQQQLALWVLRENMSLATFKTKLKTYLFRRS